ncbi:MAG: DUF3000 domain-containing protein [Propionibacteriaceae bacterium]|jgi:hypothetical protein|nr:DUF3000 domain-containing protein [Propionibacteriaceae bacterium]
MSAGEAPRLFDLVAGEVASHQWLPRLEIEEIPAPQKIAPYALAIAATLNDGGVELANGRLVLLHDPRGNASWDGDFRCVSYIGADVDPQMGADPLISDVGWSWLVDALEEQHAQYVAASGTVTSVSSKGFGEMSEDPGTCSIEIRASWTPLIEQPADIVGHLQAWEELLELAGGVPQLPESVVSLEVARRDRIK